MKSKYTSISFSILILFFSFLSSSLAGSIQLVWHPSTEADLKGYNLYLGQASRAYGPPIDVGKVTDYTLDGLENDTVYYLSLTAVDNADNESGFSSEIEIKADNGQSASPTDITPPLVNISTPTTMDSFETDQPSLNIAGEASDDNGISNIIWEADNGTRGQAEGSTTWSASGITLSEGNNVITIHAYDNVGNEAIDQLAIIYSPADNTAPVVVITSPSPSQPGGLIETTDAVIQLTGTATDDRAVTEVTWSSNMKVNGIATGTANWSIADISLSPGDNIINITAIDRAGNQGTDSLTVYYDPNQALVSAVTSASRTAYTLNDNLAAGHRAYVDRKYTYQNLPAQLDGSTYIMTANKDKKISGDSFLSFQVNKRVTVYVAHDDRINNKPTWMSTFYDTGLKLSIAAPMSIYARVYDAGPVTLGGNGGGSRTSMYTVAVSE